MYNCIDGTSKGNEGIEVHIVRNTDSIKKGYENINAKLNRLGADIRVKEVNNLERRKK